MGSTARGACVEAGPSWVRRTPKARVHPCLIFRAGGGKTFHRYPHVCLVQSLSCVAD